MIVLRKDQADLQADVFKAWQNGARNVMAVLPTGGGKSVIISDTVKQLVSNHNRGIIAAHRQELVGQMSLHIARQQIRHSILAPRNVIAEITAEHRREFNGNSYVVPSAPVTVGGVDTILSRADDLKSFAAQQNFFVIDEGHHALKVNKWGKVADMFINAYGLLVTATPKRSDGRGLSRSTDGIVDAMVTGLTMRELIEIGALCDYEIVVPDSDFAVEELTPTPSGDYTNKAMRAVAKKSHIVGDVVDCYLKYARGKRGVTFATDVETAGEISMRFTQVGIPSAMICGTTPDHVRNDAIRKFRDGSLMQLVNVDILGEGFDVPGIEVVSMARPTASLIVYMQQFGRALRVLPGKKYGLIIDHVSNIKKHGFPDRPRYWTLDRMDKRASKRDPDEIPIRVCMSCRKPYEAITNVCPYCAAVYVPPPSAGRSPIEQVDGDLTRLDRETLARMRAAVELETPASINNRVTFVAGGAAGNAVAHKQMERIEAQGRLKEAIALWAGKQRYLGRDDTQSYMRFFHATGVDVLTALTLERKEMEALTEELIKWSA